MKEELCKLPSMSRLLWLREGEDRSEINKPIGWKDTGDAQTGSAQRTLTDNTLPTGPVERIISYQAPFTKCDREKDYEMVWAVLDVAEKEA